ncbi:PP2C family protein-serine/threonine phosphatase [Haliangium sp.]|uniref:PP2C family protein-serine/threonine phosphatase n=1 Tax=Haliangium sp. TaxID=2663208 RepID=UPI003D1531E0
MQIHSAAYTHVGRRARNEDAYYLAPKAGVYAVADGMGGHEGGQVASRLAVSALDEFVRRLLADPEATWPHAQIPGHSFAESMALVATRAAHDAVTAHRTGELATMGTTLVLMLVRTDHVVVAHVGDSRLYRLRDGQLTQLTRDHSLYEELRAAGGDLPPLESFPYAHHITRALGVCAQADVATHALRPGDRYLLCSDGLTDALDDDDIAALLARGSAADAACHLSERAYEAGSRDNITTVVVVAGSG